MTVDRIATNPVRPVTPVTTEVSVNAPLDRVRWTSIIAGFFTVLATIIVLTVLGVAIGLSTVDANNPDGLVLGASIYSAIIALIAFLAGGYIAARTAAVSGSSNGVLNGGMVWIITIPILVFVLGNGIGSLLGTAVDLTTKAATVGAQVVAPAVGAVAGEVAENPAGAATAVAGAVDTTGAATAVAGVDGAVAEATTEAGDVAGTVQEQAQSAVATVQTQIDDITPAQVERTAQDASGIAWVTLLALGLSAAAAIGGGYAGARTYPVTTTRIRS